MGHSPARSQRNRSVLSREACLRAEAIKAIEAFNAALADCTPVFAIPTIAGAIISRHHWLILVCDGCRQLTDVDLTFKSRPGAMIVTRAARGLTCSRCQDGGRHRIVGLFKSPDDYAPKRRARVPTVGELQKDGRGGWAWIYCRKTGCHHRERLAYASWVILHGPYASSDLIRRTWRCSKCGHQGGQLNRG